MSPSRPDYGIDAPGLVRGFLTGGAVALVLTLLAARFAGPAVAAVPALVALYLLGMGGYMIHHSRVTKLRTREELLDRIAWRGDEAVLDVGCGRGLMLVGAARRVPHGKATGIDIWAAADQSGNTADAALENARDEGVADRVDVRTADMRDLPFADASFDVVLSHWVVHNLPDPADRVRALAEMVRVLRPGGTLVLADIAHRDAYAEALTALGLGRQHLIVDRWGDLLRAAVSFGSFRPAAILAQRG